IGDPKRYDQPCKTPGGKLTPNGKFEKAALDFKAGRAEPELVRVYEKIKDGIWAYNGVFRLVDAYREKSGPRSVFKFRLELTEQEIETNIEARDLPVNRMIPSAVKREVYNRDKGQCVLCGSKDNLHYDHDYPYSKGGSSLTAANIRLLCARHNLEKSDNIE
ncbi:MAG: HNH endonuclease, partial [Terriglobales bacterium]